MKTLFTFCFFLGFAQLLFAQINPIEVADLTFKVKGLGEELHYFCFAQDDIVVIDFKELDNKELKEFEFIKYPSDSKFMEYKVKSISGKEVSILEKGVYFFKCKNTNVSGRVCKLKIKRIPASEETAKFNTNVRWKTHRDTTYYQENERYFVRKDTVINEILNISRPISSATNLQGKPQRIAVDFTIPSDIDSWTYSIMVDQTGKQNFDKSIKELSNAIVSTKIPPAAITAKIGEIALTSPAKENVIFYFVNTYNDKQLFLSGNNFMYFKKGNTTCEYQSQSLPKGMPIYLCLENDNLKDAIQVYVLIHTYKVNDVYANRMVTKYRVNTWRQPLMSY